LPAEDFFNAHGFHSLPELVSIDSKVISQEIPPCAVERKGFDELLSGPLSIRMSGDVEMKNASAVMRE